MPDKVIANNRKAFHDYEVLERFEAGIELLGPEVKSMRNGQVNLSDSFATGSGGELHLFHLHISPYSQGNTFVNSDPYRKRRLLMHKKQIRYLAAEVDRKKLTLIPLSIYFKEQWIKVELGLCRGRKKGDKREKIASADVKRKLEHLRKTYNG
ncbi:MAG: SsrA-binding protein SmpB [Chitinivibrionales bacterium]|nr:SsrA-binding protein SmpB [Chitinivibrionales bacterium]